MRQRFEEIYARNEWHYGSGRGSLPLHTRGYTNFLQQFLRDHRIRSVLDVGCGDWQSTRLVDWSGIRYTGLDVVESVIQTNMSRFSAPNISFQLYDASEGSLPPADLLIAKDVLQHWSGETVSRFLPELRNFRYSLITNCVDPERTTQNEEIADGDFRYLDISQPPFSVSCRRVYEFADHTPWWKKLWRHEPFLKYVFLVEAADV